MESQSFEDSSAVVATRVSGRLRKRSSSPKNSAPTKQSRSIINDENQVNGSTISSTRTRISSRVATRRNVLGDRVPELVNKTKQTKATKKKAAPQSMPPTPAQNKSAHNVSCNKSVAASEQSKSSTETMDKRFAFVRVSDSKTRKHPSPSLLSFPLFEGAIIGRNSKVATNQSSNVSVLSGESATSQLKPSSCKKLDLGIPFACNGVSRKQVVVESVSSFEQSTQEFRVILSVPIGVQNPLRIVSFQQSRENPRDTIRRVQFLGEGKRMSLKEGDLVEFDPYNSDPQHVFCLLRAQPFIPVHIGDRVRVRFKNKDVFDMEQLGWYVLCHVMSPSEQTHIEFPSDDIDVLHPAPKEGHRGQIGDGRVFVNNGKSASEGPIAYDCHPKDISVGDLVDCIYQDSGLQGKWFRGHIASISRDKKTCDVFYCDEEYECNVPLRQGKIRLIDRGSSCRDWVEKSRSVVKIPPGEGHLSQRIIIPDKTMDLDDSAETRLRWVISQHQIDEIENKGKKTIRYSELLKDLFVNIRKSCEQEGQLRYWPGSVPTKKVTKKRGQAPTHSTENVPKRRASKRIKKTASETKKRPLSKEIQPRSSDSCQGDKQSISSPNNTQAPSNSICDKSGETASQETLGSPAPISPVFELSRDRLREMNPSLADRAWRSLNSAEPHVGFGILEHMTVVHNAAQTASLGERLLDLLKSGPKSDGIVFCEPNRMELAVRYMKTLIKKSESVNSSAINDFGPKSWDDFESFLSMPMIRAKPIPEALRETESVVTVRRLGIALNHSAGALEVMETLLSCQLQSFVENGNLDGYDITPISSIILQHTGTIREAMKTTLSWSARCLIRHLHWVSVPLSSSISPSDRDAYRRCTQETQRCLDAFGSIVSHVVWLFCRKEGVSMHDRRCVFVVKDVILSELEQCIPEFIPEPKKKRKQSASADLDSRKDILLSYVLSLKSPATGHFKKALAKTFGIESEFSLFS
eukprot:scaffold8470_cov47-Attheya_sp.AAC.3